MITALPLPLRKAGTNVGGPFVVSVTNLYAGTRCSDREWTDLDSKSTFRSLSYHRDDPKVHLHFEHPHHRFVNKTVAG